MVREKAIEWWANLLPQEKQSLINKSDFLVGVQQLRSPSSLAEHEIEMMYRYWVTDVMGSYDDDGNINF